MENSRRNRIKRRVRAKVYGTPERPRLCVFRSNKYIYTQLIDDNAGKTLLTASYKDLDGSIDNKTDMSKKVGVKIAEKALGKGIENVVFDRNGYLYHGRVKAVADGAREGGLKF